MTYAAYFARALCLALASLAATSVHGQTSAFPNRPIRVVVVVPPGGAGDTVARTAANALSAAYPQPAVVENRPGAGGTIAVNLVAKAPADGYTLVVSDQGPTVHAGALFKQLPYDPARDLTMVSWIATTTFVLVAGPGLKANNLKELIEQAKAKPGSIAYGNAGAGTHHHLSMELFKLKSGTDFNPVFYKGGAPAVQDAVGGQVPIAVSGLVTTESLIKSGKLRLIAVMGQKRFPAYPDVPALAEYAPGFEGVSMLGVWAPAGTPRDVLQSLNQVITKSLTVPENVKRLTDLGLDPLVRNLDESQKIWQNELAVWPDLIRRLKITLD